jgi:hypothetical protein
MLPQVIKGETVRFAHYGQMGMDFDPDVRVLDLVKDAAEEALVNEATGVATDDPGAANGVVRENTQLEKKGDVMGIQRRLWNNKAFEHWNTTRSSRAQSQTSRPFPCMVVVQVSGEMLARQLLQRFQFPVPRWQDVVAKLSGGERRRLQVSVHDKVYVYTLYRNKYIQLYIHR